MPNHLFMQNLNGLAVREFFLSAFDGSTHQITSITAGPLNCEGNCDDLGLYLAEGTSGWILTYDGDEIYGDYTEDRLTETELLDGLNVTVWNMIDMSSGFYYDWTPWSSGVSADYISSICTDSAHVANVDGISFLEKNGCQLESDYTEWDEGYGDVAAHFTGYITAPYSGTVQFCSSTDDGFHLDIDGTLVVSSWYLQGSND
jgi:hypothetical protein